MANFWAGVGQGFSQGFEKAWDSAARRREREEDRKQALKDRQDAWDREDKLRQKVADLRDREIRAALMAQNPEVVTEAAMNVGGFPMKSDDPNAGELGYRSLDPTVAKGVELYAAGEAAKTIAAERAAEKAAERSLQNALTLQKEKHKQDIIKQQTPTAKDITDIKGIRELAKFKYDKADELTRERFFKGLDIQTADPAVLKDINDRLDAFENAKEKYTDTYYTAQRVGEDIKTFRKQIAEINKLQSQGKEVPKDLLDNNIQLGDTLTYLHSTRSVLPAGVADLIGNAPKRPNSIVLRDVTRSHEIALLAEELAGDVNFLKDKIGEEKMLKAIGLFDNPVENIKQMLGININEKEEEAMRRLKQKAQALQNRTLKLRSGLAVTESEAQRFEKEFGSPDRADYFRSLNAFAANVRGESRKALQAQMDAGYIFNKSLRDKIGFDSAPQRKESSAGEKPASGQQSDLTPREAELLKKLNNTDKTLWNKRQRDIYNQIQSKIQANQKPLSPGFLPEPQELSDEYKRDLDYLEQKAKSGKPLSTMEETYLRQLRHMAGEK